MLEGRVAREAGARMHETDLILTLTGAFAAALLLGFVTHRLKLSPLVGYVLAGIAVGPHTPGYTADKGIADQLAEVGVILLMFGVGLKFHFKELLAVRRVAIPGAIAQIAVATLLGVVTTQAFGWDLRAGVVFGLAISVASTVVLLRVLSDSGELHQPVGHVAVGWLVVEDLFTVLVLVTLPALFGAEQAAGGPWLALLVALLKVVALVMLTFVIGERVVPKLLSYVAATRSRELFTLAVLVLALGLGVGSAKLFGVSMALGAFLAGMIVGRSEFSLRAASEALPMRDAFAVLFFVSVGMLFNPRFVLEQPGLIAASLAIVVIGKPLAAIAIVLLLRYTSRMALAVGIALAQIGEFSFILATVGRDLELLPPEATSTLVATSIFSITLNPLLYRLVPRFTAWRARRVVDSARLSRSPASRSSRHGAIVVGWGPVGQTVARLLAHNGIEPTIVELNLETVRKLKAEGRNAVYGDGNQPDVLAEAGVEHAISLVLSAPTEPLSVETVRQIHRLNPKLLVVARCSYLREVGALREAGAAAAFSGEGEVALAMAGFILRELGAPPEHIDRERHRVHAELFPEDESLSRS
jgi:CPA2 family monovalent cation:H+ antiporter-2